METPTLPPFFGNILAPATLAGRGYHMSESEKDTQVGRLLREKKLAAQTLAELTEKARGLGKNLVSIGTALCDTPTAITFANVSTDTRIHTPIIVDQLPLLEDIKALVLAIQVQYLAEREAAEALTRLGY